MGNRLPGIGTGIVTAAVNLSPPHTPPFVHSGLNSCTESVGALEKREISSFTARKRATDATRSVRFASVAWGRSSSGGLVLLAGPLREDGTAFVLVESTPDSERLPCAQGVLAALHDHRAALAHLFRPCLPGSPGGATLVVGMEEDRRLLTTAGPPKLPVPLLDHRLGQSLGVSHGVVSPPGHLRREARVPKRMRALTTENHRKTGPGGVTAPTLVAPAADRRTACCPLRPDLFPSRG